METIADRLNAVKQVKTDIKTAIAEKGLDMEGVPFTQYAEKVAMIGATEIIPLEVTENGTYTAEEGEAFNPVTVNVPKSAAIKTLVDLRGNADYLFSNIPRYKDNEFLELFDFNVTENATSFNNTFMSVQVVYIPPFNISKATELRSTFRMATRLENAPLLDTKHIQGFNSAVNQCGSIKTIPEWDVRSGTDFGSCFNSCMRITEIWWKNIKASLQVGSGSSWGHLLTLESLIHLIYQLRDTGAGKTLTMGNVNLEKLANVYVRTIEITDEMRAEDDLIDEKLPFEVCESTDDGAVLITDYVALKNWTLA